jgi:hypothetical protein
MELGIRILWKNAIFLNPRPQEPVLAGNFNNVNLHRYTKVQFSIQNDRITLLCSDTVKKIKYFCINYKE